MPTLEEFKLVNGQAAQAWVCEQNAKTQTVFDTTEEFAQMRDACFNALSIKTKIAPPIFSQANFFLNFWVDAQNPKGILRKTDRASYRAGNPNWDVLLDIDALSQSEGRNWVYKGITEDFFNRRSFILIHLSDGGSDAMTMREFDIGKKCFLDNGFFIPPASDNDVEWLTENSLLVSTNFGEGTLTKSGYPASIRKLKRKKSLTQAETLFTVDTSHLGISIRSCAINDKDYFLFTDKIDFYHSVYYVASKKKLKKQYRLPLPLDCEIHDFFNNMILITLRSTWQFSDAMCFPANSLIAFDIGKFLKNPRGKSALDAKILFLPGERRAIQSVQTNNHSIFVLQTNNVTHELFELNPTRDGFESLKVPLPDNGSINICTLSGDSSDVFLTCETLLDPCSLYVYNSTTHILKKLGQNPAYFDSSHYETKQLLATSKDGTKIPYHVVLRKNTKLDGSNPTVLYGYGGFESSLSPTYLGLDGIGLLERGAIYVQANIRGGGEFGTDWHKYGSLEYKQNSFDDFIAVAEDLIRKKITSRQFLAIEGASNGGLLVGACVTQRPELFAGALCEVALLDMLIYHRLLAGDSWVGEYGDPTDPAMRAILEAYSPLHHIDPSKQYPPMMISTSTTDNRVHPYHARAMAFTLQQFGNTVYFFEDPDGGHSSYGTNLMKVAENTARNFQFYYETIIKPALAHQRSLVPANNSRALFPGIGIKRKNEANQERHQKRHRQEEYSCTLD